MLLNTIDCSASILLRNDILLVILICSHHSSATGNDEEALVSGWEKSLYKMYGQQQGIITHQAKEESSQV
jgi:hypothetical protein